MIGSATALQGGKNDWKPIDPEHLAQKAPLVEPEADAEAIFWEVRVEDQWTRGAAQTVLEHYIRIKVFNERGRDSQSLINIPYAKKERIDNIAGRTILPDGKVLKLHKKSIYERTLLKGNGVEVRVKSFAMPGVQIGSLIEYRWRETRLDPESYFHEFHFQRDIPVQLVKYFIKPFQAASEPGYSMYGLTLNGGRSPFLAEQSGHYSTLMVQVPAFREEKDMPPELNLRSWMLLYYSNEKEGMTPQEYWQDYGKQIHESAESLMKADDSVAQLALQLTQDIFSKDKKLHRIFDYCQSKIRNLDEEPVIPARKGRNKDEDIRSSSETLKDGSGTSLEIDLLFGALARAAGFDARYANVADRDFLFFSHDAANPFFLPSRLIAIPSGQEWIYFAPSNRHVPVGSLAWQQEGQKALISDPDRPLFVETPRSPAGHSLQKRSGELRLSVDGTLEGACRFVFSGHQAAVRRELLDGQSPQELEKAVQKQVMQRLKNAQVSEVRVENLQDSSQPLTYRFQVRVQGYAQATGKRMFLPPAVFQSGLEPRYSASRRRHALYFPFPWSEEDQVSIVLPKGAEVEAGEPPLPFPYATVAQHSAQLEASEDGRRLDYQRSFSFSGLDIPASSYAAVKEVFDALHESDAHTVILKLQQENDPASPE